MQIVTGRPRQIHIPESETNQLGARVAHVLQVGWLCLHVGALLLAIVATPLLHTHLQTICPDHLCDILSQPNATSAAYLTRVGVPLHDYATVMVAVEWVFMLLWLALGGIIIAKQSRDPAGVALAYLAVPLGSSIFLRVLRDTYPSLWAPFLVNDFVMTAALVLFFCLFPDGRWVPRWMGWVAAAMIGYVALATTLSAVLGNARLAASSVPVAAVPWLIVIGAQIYRYRRVSTLVQQQQTKWLLVGLALFALTIVVALGAWLTGFAAHYQWLIWLLCYGSSVAMLAAFGFAILRYRLFAIDLVINRALVYGCLTFSVIGLYALIVGTLSTIFAPGAPARADVVITFIATGAVAVLFQPLRAGIQRRIDRVLYGERHDPYGVLTRLGQRLEATFAAAEIVPTLVETVRESLQLPYVAVTLGQDETAAVAAASGSRPVHCIRFPLTYQGATVGHLVVSPRRGEAHLAQRDECLLADLAHQAGVAVHGVQVMDELRHALADLQRARERLVLAREEERRRLRRDLHDDLAPTLAGLAITAGTIKTLIPADPAKAVALADEQQTAIREAVSNIRRLVYDLRPPSLDELGLLAAIRDRAAQYSDANLTISVEAPAVLPPLPAAVEVAAYRIMQEALMNVVKHARAHHCTIRLTLADSLSVTVTDDGTGLDAAHAIGVGLRSMRERAVELGGTCTIERRADQGTHLVVSLPLGTEIPDEQPLRADR